MKKDIDNQISLIKESIDWWKEESFKTSLEAEHINMLYELGEIREEEAVDKLQELSNRINYLSQKGVFEQKGLFETFTKSNG
tara:strand:+ start:1104 stop:1349 length:246 start_codon:yes stop_codon:yes gene_type:complete